MQDTVAVLSKYIDALVVRSVGDGADFRAMAAADQLPIINAMNSDEHPTQALNDLATMQRHFGGLEGLRVLYVGEANSTAVALAYGAARIRGMELDCRTPCGYGFSNKVLADVSDLSHRFGGLVRTCERAPDESDARLADVVYTTRWRTMGIAKADLDWHSRFTPYTITQDVMAVVSKGNRSVFMHDLPAVRGEECTSEVLDGPPSIALFQAAQKLYTAMAVLEWAICA